MKDKPHYVVREVVDGIAGFAILECTNSLRYPVVSGKHYNFRIGDTVRVYDRIFRQNRGSMPVIVPEFQEYRDPDTEESKRYFNYIQTGSILSKVDIPKSSRLVRFFRWLWED